MADQFRTVVGVVEFPPRDGDAGGKPVRNIVISQTGFKEQAVKVYATVWPSHAHVALEEGDVVAARGKLSVNKTTNAEGQARTYHNLSVTSIGVLGQMDSGERVDVENAAAAEDDDDIPF